MIYDTFLFHGELDLLELRLNILGKVVDKFVICEARQNFSGTPYESLYLANKERFKAWEDKIIHFQFNLLEDQEIVEQARNSKNTSHGNPYWMKVYYAMEMMRKPLEVCQDEDIVFISDCDEIWNPDSINAEVKIIVSDDIIGFKQLAYYYQLNNRCSEAWTGSICLSYKRLRNEIINNIKQKGEVKILNGGWHFTYQGGEAEVKRKLISTRTPGEQDQTDSYYGWPTEKILENVKNGEDIFAHRFGGREFKFWTDESDWPEYLKENKQKYLHLCR